jgi:beta-xylosidase
VTTTLTPRAPTPGGPHRWRRRDHSGWKMALGALMVLAAGLATTRTVTHASEHAVRAVAGPTPSLPTSSPKADAATARPASASAPRPEPVGPPGGEHSWPPQRLAPRPPADGRDAPDPVVVHDGALWALYSTQVGFHNVPVATSPDLRHWSPPSDALPRLPDWAAWGRTWAPGVVRLGGRYVLYFAAHHDASGRQCIGVATSAAATGPFVSQATEPLVCQIHLGGSIDPHPFVDADGSVYLLWKADGNAIGQTSQIFSQALQPDGLALAGEPVPLLHYDAPWERPLIENPALLAAGGTYLLVYSGGWWESAGYATGYAVCDTPLGPCAKQTTTQPILAATGNQAGTGGASVVTGPAGHYWLVHHAWTTGTIGYGNGGARSVHFVPLTWDGNQLDVGRQRVSADPRPGAGTAASLS